MRKLIVFPLLVMMSLPALASAQTTADLHAQAQALLAQVQALQAQLAAQQGGQVVTSTNGTVYPGTGVSVPVAGGAGVNSSTCPNIGRVLKRGSSGADVTRLQQFLAGDPSIYPEGIISGYYGSLTQKAVEHWQTRYNIVSSGTPGSTGFGVVGPRTAAAIALLCSTGAGVSGKASSVGGYIQVSPISGNTPLSVNVQATVNTTNSCVGAIYSLNWGDGSNGVQIPVSANTCGQINQTYTHVYNYGGTFQITLSAGAHQTSATVTVYGPTAPSQPTTPTTPAPNTNIPLGGMQITPGIGGNPLAVQITFSLGSSCSPYTLTWGDGSNDNYTGPPQGTSCAQSVVSGLTKTHTYGSAGSYTITLTRGSQVDTAGVTITN
ncbi:peptidoglycan-binding protein [Candidatus Kaiserbacteria bacterium]|nr:peptidoglycan-binding protein [Candidatus Kaiserbacteria bacterium]